MPTSVERRASERRQDYMHRKRKKSSRQLQEENEQAGALRSSDQDLCLPPLRGAFLHLASAQCSALKKASKSRTSNYLPFLFLYQDLTAKDPRDHTFDTCDFSNVTQRSAAKLINRQSQPCPHSAGRSRLRALCLLSSSAFPSLERPHPCVLSSSAHAPPVSRPLHLHHLLDRRLW